MAPVTTIAEIGKHEGQTVTIRGWLYNLRESGKLLFPIFRDGSGVIQGVVPKSAVPPEALQGATNLMFPTFRSSSAFLTTILIRFPSKSMASIS